MGHDTHVCTHWHLATSACTADSHCQAHTAVSGWPSVSGPLSHSVGFHVTTAFPDSLVNTVHLILSGYYCTK